MDFDNKYRARLEKLSTTNVADALDALGLKGATYGIRPIWEGAGKIVGRAVTVKITAAGLTKGKHHLGVKAIDVAEAGDVIVVDNGGRLDTSCWGGILANGAKMKGISGVVIDGACRDVDDYVEIGFPVYARGSVVATARGRVMEEATNVLIQFGGVQVRPGDVVVADRSGVVIIPQEKLDEVVAKAEELYEKEEKMIAEIRAGVSMLEVDSKYNYEKMLK
ncbi:Ribonuclease E inhibitor RraA/Dimethylmenaquinone methyltransferase [Moorella glycerini]|uniref:Putative 4-hydroxy-4-methyl-2-oxoglutarate aldolase n=1 Tax=Neomoorella stamsii TaxID=1266720 RepID=A0A9X7J1K8_9FIRM|nr:MULTISPECIES: RraA family protein [Moorella]PRR70055.1 4-hydroxy-4-methyl-2-oxoglutarate aldolase [Moorella stamsii]CEP66123.1 Ribonuclease E inhibitor RraA/Dimethylmenaquinone methyltransferase [Moorella glycerini]